MKKLRYFLPLAMAFLLSCGQSPPLSERELAAFVADSENGLSKAVKVNTITVQVSYRPTDLLVAQALAGKDSVSVKKVADARNRFRGHYYFVVSLSRNQQELLNVSERSHAQFSELLQTVSFRMGEVARMTNSRGNNLVLADYLYQRTYGMGTSTDLLFVFEKSRQDSHWVEFVLDEFGLGIGPQTFRFQVADLEQAPLLFPVSNRL